MHSSRNLGKQNQINISVKHSLENNEIVLIYSKKFPSLLCNFLHENCILFEIKSAYKTVEGKIIFGGFILKKISDNNVEEEIGETLPYMFKNPQDYDLLWEQVKPKINDIKGKAIIQSTPMGNNFFYNMWMDSQK